MSGYREIATLSSFEVVQNGDGTRMENRTDRDVFANEMTIGFSAWNAARSNGLHADASIQMRTCDYNGEQSVTMRGVPYEVERVQSSGEYTTLTLKRRIANVKDDRG